MTSGSLDLREAAPTPEWCMAAFYRVNPGAHATMGNVPSLYLLDFAREVLHQWRTPFPREMQCWERLETALEAKEMAEKRAEEAEVKLAVQHQHADPDRQGVCRDCGDDMPTARLVLAQPGEERTPSRLVAHVPRDLCAIRGHHRESDCALHAGLPAPAPGQARKEHPRPELFDPLSDVGPDDDRCPGCGTFHAAHVDCDGRPHEADPLRPILGFAFPPPDVLAQIEAIRRPVSSPPSAERLVACPQNLDIKRLVWLLQDVADRLPATDVGRERYGECLGFVAQLVDYLTGADYLHLNPSAERERLVKLVAATFGMMDLNVMADYLLSHGVTAPRGE